MRYLKSILLSLTLMFTPGVELVESYLSVVLEIF